MDSKKLKPKLEESIELLCKTVYALWCASLNNNKNCIDLNKSMEDIREGDLVLEVTSLPNRKNYKKALGYIEKFQKSKLGEDQITLRRLINDKIIIWSNYKFVRVPDSHLITKFYNDDPKRNYLMISAGINS